MTAKDALERLKSGNDHFASDTLYGQKQDSKRREVLLERQNPFAIILSCTDSRVVPELIFDTGLGELFVVRVEGNVANTASLASIEYAVTHLGTKLILVMAHQNCDAIMTAIAGGDNGYNMNHLLAHITPAIEACSEHAVTTDTIAKKNAELAKKDLTSRSPIIKHHVDTAKVEIISAFYNLDTGVVDFI